MDELFAPLSAREASLKSPLSLALLGDTVWDLLIRRELLATQKNAGALHRAAVLRVDVRRLPPISRPFWRWRRAISTSPSARRSPPSARSV